MKYRIISAILIITLIIVTGCSGSPAEKAEQTAATEQSLPQPETPIGQTGENSQIQPWNGVITEETAEDETEVYVFDDRAAEWFSEILSEWVKGGADTLSDEAKVGTALYELADGEVCEDMMFDASVSDWSPVRAQGDVEAYLSGCNISKTSGEPGIPGDAASYGKNAAIQVLDGAFLQITTSRINARVANTAGVAAYNGAVVCIANSSIKVTGSGSPVILVSEGSSLFAWNPKLTAGSSNEVAIRDGSRCIMNIIEYTLEGVITVDDTSTLEINLASSAFTGAVNPAGAAGTADIIMDQDSSWVLTADSYVSSFEGSLDNVDASGHHLYIDGEQVK